MVSGRESVIRDDNLVRWVPPLSSPYYFSAEISAPFFERRWRPTMAPAHQERLIRETSCNRAEDSSNPGL